jgi:hypothetical protein
MFFRACLIIFSLLIPVLASGQASSDVQADNQSMETPTPVAGQGYSLELASATPHTNYLSGGVRFTAAYDDRVSVIGGQNVSDQSYSIGPTLILRQSRPRLNWGLSYGSDFTFYQHASSLNQADNDFALDLQYRISPHVTVRLQDSFLKTSNFFNSQYQDTSFPSLGVVQRPNDSIVAPITNRISNFGSTIITYQFRQNAMMGAKATLSQLWYPDAKAGSDLFDSTGQAAEGFYAHRLSGRHYIGATYQFQKILAHPSTSETVTDSVLAFYTLYLQPSISFSVFVGPQYAEFSGGERASFHSWSPAAGASLGWQGVRTAFAFSYAHTISEGGGLSGGVLLNSANALFRRQLTRSLDVELGSTYAVNEVLDPLSAFSSGGHSVSGTVSLKKKLGAHLSAVAAYTGLHQSYGGTSSRPDRNRVWISLFYQFETPLGR